jgi:hypothetical protein
MPISSISNLPDKSAPEDTMSLPIVTETFAAKTGKLRQSIAKQTIKPAAIFLRTLVLPYLIVHV